MDRQVNPNENNEELKVADFEQSVQRLEVLINSLEQSETGLEASIQLYEEGLSLIKRCNEMLDQAKIRIETVAAKANK